MPQEELQQESERQLKSFRFQQQQQEGEHSYREKLQIISNKSNKFNNENLKNNSSKEKTTLKNEKDLNSSYAKPTLSSKFKSVKKTVNRLAKYRPTQEVMGFKKSSTGKPYRLSMDPALLQPFQALSKASLRNAEEIYQAVIRLLNKVATNHNRSCWLISHLKTSNFLS